MGHSHTKDANGQEITIERIEEFYGFLQGNEVEGIHCKDMPRLSLDEANSVI